MPISLVSKPMTRRSLRYKVRRLRSLSLAQWKHLLRALWLIPAARIVLAAVPFKSILAYMDQIEPTGKVATPSFQAHASWALALVARHLLGDKPCLTQALAMQYLLQRRATPSTLRIGVKRDENGGLAAHAWIECENRVVIGGADSPSKYALLQSPEQLAGTIARI